MGVKTKKVLSFGFIVIGMLFIALPFINVTKILNRHPIYDNSADPESVELSFPIVQKIHMDKPGIEYLNWQFSAGELNKHKFHISIHDENGVDYFEYDYENYEPDIIKAPLDPMLEDGANELTMEIDCGDCNAMEFNLYESSDSGSYVEGYNKTLMIEGCSYSRNYGYFWHTALFITIGLVLLSMSKEEDEKKC